MDDAETFSIAALAAPHPLAAAAGRDVLVEGGTVIEAALAAAMVSAVVVPDRAGLGGALGIGFDDAMLSWPPGRRATDGVRAPSWYDKVERSTGFAAP